MSVELMYEFHAKELTQTEALKQIADHAVKEIKETVGQDADVEVSIEPEIKDKHLFTVSMVVTGAGEPFVVKKHGKNVMAVLKKVRKIALRQIHRASQKRVAARRKHFMRHQWAS